MELAHKYRTLLAKNGITTPLRLAHFFAQIDHESGLKPISENLNYSAEALRIYFRKYFPTIELANQYARKPERIANRVYANRMENGNEASGDGWRNRGRGFIQTTGARNLRLLSEYTGINYLKNPDLLLNEADAMIAALYYWNSNNLNRYADRDDIDAVSDAINIGRQTETYGDANGFKDRADKLKKYKKIFNV